MICIMRVLIAGYKQVSLTDVYGEPVFTLWLCRCNLRCPFCHNWRLAVADHSVCRYEDVDGIVEDIARAKPYITYLHVTGGEPLIQVDALERLFTGTRGYGIDNSLNTNLTFPDRLERLLSKDLVEHIASDLKVPFQELTGLGERSRGVWERFRRSLEILSGYNVLFELRIPVAHELTLRYIDTTLECIGDILKRIHRIYCIVNPLVGEPLVNPRDRDWSRRYCNPSMDEVERVAEIVRERIGCRVYVRRWWVSTHQ